MDRVLKHLIVLTALIWGVCPWAMAQDKMSNSKAVRLAVVITPQYSGLIDFLRDYLLNPDTQAKIAAFRSPGCDKQLWWPAGRDN